MDARRLQSTDKGSMNVVVSVIRGLAQRIIRLVGNEDQQVPGALEPAECRCCSLSESKVSWRERGFHASRDGVQDQGVEDAVAIEKDGGPGHLADSHFIWFARRRGWETMRCQTTA